MLGRKGGTHELDRAATPLALPGFSAGFQRCDHAFRQTGQAASFDTPAVSVPKPSPSSITGALVIDVRERSVSAGSHLPGALLIPLEVVAAHLSKMELAKAQTIIVYCNQGTGRGPAAVQALAEAGFTNVVNLQAGIEGWRGAGMPTAKS